MLSSVLRSSVVVLACLLLHESEASAQTRDEAQGPLLYPRMLFDQRATMRDGIELSAEVYLPKEPGQYPALLIRTPYLNNGESSLEFGRYFARAGYAVVIQDVRGRGESDGEFDVFFQEDEDGYDTVEWVAQQPWCNGKVGLMGGSYLGYVQWAAAKLRPPHLVALASTAAVGRTFREYHYNYGAVNLYPLRWYFGISGRTSQNFDMVDWATVFNHLPLATMDEAMGMPSQMWQEYIAHPTFDDYWKRMDLAGHFENIDYPALHITGWFDGDQAGQMFFYEGMTAESPAADRQWLLFGPWTHGGTRNPTLEVADFSFEKEAIVDMKELHLRWFDYWLKDKTDNGIDKEPKVKYYLTGINKWLTSPSWPPPRVSTENWYLHSGGTANTMAGDGVLSREPPRSETPDRYIYNPEFPVPTTPDKGLSYTHAGGQSLDQRFVERRDDILVYTSELLTEPMAIAGRIKLVFYASSDARDTDFMAKLIDVHPDERAVMLGPYIGVIRARFRDSLSEPRLMTPGEIYRFEIDLSHVGHVFQPGHRVRVEITSSNFPLYARNPNTGAPIGTTTEMRLARQTIFHDSEHPSTLILPVLPAEVYRHADRASGNLQN